MPWCVRIVSLQDASRPQLQGEAGSVWLPTQLRVKQEVATIQAARCIVSAHISVDIAGLHKLEWSPSCRWPSVYEFELA